MRPFEFRSGALSLDFTDTVARRGTEEIELIKTVHDLVQWAASSGQLPFMANARPDETELVVLRDLREAIYRAASAIVEQREIDTDDVMVLNDEARRSPARAVFIDGEARLVADNPLEAMRSALASNAIGIIGGTRKTRIRQCSGCGMIFLDNSRPGRRKWCSSSAGCGNREKTRSYRKTLQNRKVGR